jgi:hypothetical protein
VALNYSVNPSPTTGSNTAYGLVPGQISTPPSTYEQVGSVYPNLGAQTGQLSSNVTNELAGQLSPQTIAALQQHAAQFGVQSGMPGSQFQGHQGLASLGLNTEAMQQQGQKDYLSALTSIGSTQTPQALAAEIASSNATLAAAPNPQMAAEKQMSDWMAKFNAASGAGRGGGGGGASVQPTSSPSGGTGNYDPVWDSLAYGVSGQSGFIGGSGTQASTSPVNLGVAGYSGLSNQPTSSGSMYMGSYQPPVYGSDIYDPTGSMFDGQQGMSQDEWNYNVDSGL